MRTALVAAILLALSPVAHAWRGTGTLETADGTARVVVTGLLRGSGDRLDGRWRCRGAGCPIRSAKFRLKCGGSFTETTTEGILWTGRRNAPRRLFRLRNPTSCEALFPSVVMTLLLPDGQAGGVLTLNRGASSPSGAFLEAPELE